MQEIRKYGNPKNDVVGYQQLWYAGGATKWSAMIRVDSQTMDQAFLDAEFMRLPLPKPALWRPVPVPYANESYLIGDVVVILSRLVNPGKRKMMPHKIIAMLSHTPESIKRTADELGLSLETIVEKLR